MFQCNRLLLFISLIAQTLCCQGQEDRNYWIERYLSVSYPLQHIKVTSPYGNRKDPFTGKAAFHSGIDLKARNEEVLSMFDGYVEQIGEDSRSGRYVVLRHGDYQVSYCHLSMVTAYERIQKVRKECADALRRDGLTDSSQIVFIETYAPAAIEQQRKYGIPASVTLAQMALESRWGTSKLAMLDNNYFGIKASKRWLSDGRPYNTYDDDRKNEKFCVFSDALESMEYHSAVLMGDRYRRCRAFAPDDWLNWLVGIKEAGYATSNIYVQECSKIILSHHLQRYDVVAMTD